MTFDGITEACMRVGELKTGEMTLRDQTELLTAYMDFAERVTPLIAKYLDGVDVDARMQDVVKMLKAIKEGCDEQERNDNGDI